MTISKKEKIFFCCSLLLGVAVITTGASPLLATAVLCLFTVFWI
jgi:hypothetical protein